VKFEERSTKERGSAGKKKKKFERKKQKESATGGTNGLKAFLGGEDSVGKKKSRKKKGQAALQVRPAFW